MTKPNWRQGFALVLMMFGMSRIPEVAGKIKMITPELLGEITVIVLALGYGYYLWVRSANTTRP